MTINFKEIYQNIKDKDMLLIWAVALGLLILLVIVSLFLSFTDKSKSQIPEQYNLSQSQFDNSNSSLSLTPDNSSSSNLSNIESFPKTLSIYKSSIPEITTNITNWLSNSGKSVSDFKCDDISCLWKPLQGKEVLQYSKITGDLSFNIATEYKLDTSSNKLDDQVNVLAKQIVKDISGRDMNFSGAFKSNFVGTSFQNNEYTYFLNRTENGYLIWGEYENASGNYINFDKNGVVISAGFQLVDLISSGASEVPLIPVSKITTFSAQLPMKYIADPYSLSKIQNQINGSTVYKQNNDVAFIAGISDPKSCNYSDIKLGLKYVDTVDGKNIFIPMYKLSCNLNYTLNKKAYEVPGVVLVNAY
jgi:hypothetical protein